MIRERAAQYPRTSLTSDAPATDGGCTDGSYGGGQIGGQRGGQISRQVAGPCGKQRRSPQIIGLMGSYRRHGMIDQAVEAVLRAAAAEGAIVQQINLNEQSIEFCTNCRACLQEPGPQRGQCILQDDMASILAQIDTADALVLGAPVNFGNINALTRRFLERCVGYGYWPWGTAMPQKRHSHASKPAILITSSAAPGWMTRWLSGAVGALKNLAQMLDAQPIGLLLLGLVEADHPKLSERQQQQAIRLGKRLVRHCPI